MSDKDYGYFGKGSTGYAQYKTSFDRNFGGPDKQSSGCSGCGFWVNLVFVVVAVLLIHCCAHFLGKHRWFQGVSLL